MGRYVVEIVRHGYRKVEAEDYDGAEQTAIDLNICNGVVWSDFVDVIRVNEIIYEGERWGDLSPADREYLLLDYKLRDIVAWEKGEEKEFTGNGMCFVGLSADCCYINGVVYDGALYINEDDVIVCL